MKKYIPPVIVLFVDIIIYTFQPELTSIRLFVQTLFYFSLLRILVFKTDNSDKLTNLLLKWTLGIGLILPIFLIKTDLLLIDQVYIADIVILVPILFYELSKKVNKPNEDEDNI